MTTKEITAKLEIILEEQLGVSLPIVHSKTWKELGADSLDDVEIVMAVESDLDLTINDEDAERLAKMPVAQGIQWLEMQLR